MHGENKDDYKIFEQYRIQYKDQLNEALINQNAAFIQAVRMAVAAKNKSDYPPLGPTDPNKQAFQAMKIKQLMYAIQDTYSNDYAKQGLWQSGMAGLNTLGTWAGNTGRGTSRALSTPSATASSTYKSAKSMFGFKGGRRRKHRKTRRKQN